MNTTFTEQEKERIMDLKKAVRNGISKALIPLNTTLRGHLINNCILTGGCTASICASATPNDWDLLFKKEQDAVSFQQYIQDNNSDVMDIVPQYATAATGTKLVTINAVTLKNKVQVINWKWKRENFDFIHCMPYYDIKEDKFYISREQFDSIQNYKLVINPGFKINPANLLDDKRIEKWIKRGFSY
jgi:hypothetical protein